MCRVRTPKAELAPSWVQSKWPYGSYVTCFVVDGPYLFAGTNGVGVNFSTNGGISLASANSGFPYKFVSSLEYTNVNLFAGAPRGILLSTNDGTSWSPADSGLADKNVSSLIASDTIVFAGTGVRAGRGLIQESQTLQFDPL